MKVLVTGATGFLGANLVHHLVARGDQVRVLKRPKTPPTLLEGLPVEIAAADLVAGVGRSLARQIDHPRALDLDHLREPR